MSELISALIVAIVQGFTEWLPISSSGHLVLFEKILEMDSGGLVFDVALHFGTLMAVFVYFGKDIMDIMRDFFLFKFDTENGKLGVYLLIATIPAGVFGLLLHTTFENAFNNLFLVAGGFAVTSLILFIASIDFGHRRELGVKGALFVGFVQVISLFPGISRSGSTISAGMLWGLKEEKALKFSFLMSIPVILGANIVTLKDATQLPSDLIWATLVAFFVGLVSIHFMYKYVLTKKKNMKWFALYALLLSLGIGIYLLV
jgi:undecaprenyl-diphosphatase